MSTSLVVEEPIPRTTSRKGSVIRESDFAGVSKSQALRSAIKFLFDKLYVTGGPLSYPRVRDQNRNFKCY